MITNVRSTPSTAERCSVKGCDRPAESLGVCGMHYQQALFRRPGAPFVPGLQRRSCSIPGCTSVACARGLCHRHYARWRRGKELRQEGA